MVRHVHLQRKGDPSELKLASDLSLPLNSFGSINVLAIPHFEYAGHTISW